jgi:hypothetical protein
LKRSEHYDDYPKPVSELTEKLLDGLEEEKFFEAEQADYNITFRRFADLALKKWINGDDMEDFTEDEFSQILRFSMVETDLLRMSERGLLDSIENTVYNFSIAENMFYEIQHYSSRAEMTKILKRNFKIDLWGDIYVKFK